MKSLISFSNIFIVIVWRVLVSSVAVFLPIAVSFAQTQFNGTYTQSFTDASGTYTLTFTVTNGVVTGTATNSNVVPSSAILSGTVAASGAITFVGGTNCGTITYTGQITLTSSGGATATGTVTGLGVGPASNGGTICVAGSSTWTATRTATTGVAADGKNPAAFNLLQSYPNPFNPTATIEYHVPVSGFIKLSVYDILGSEITLLVNENKSVGNHRVTFDARGLAGGIYFYRMQASSFSETKKLILLR